MTIFFVDENQIISPFEVGEPAVIRETAHRLGVVYQEFKLVSQFRCNGSDAYLAWLDDVFELGGPSQGLELATPTGFDFKLVGSPHQLVDEIRQKNSQNPNSAPAACWLVLALE